MAASVATNFSAARPLAATSKSAPRDIKVAVASPNLGTVLIIEDDPLMLELFQLLFEGEGHPTLVAANGRAALKLVATLAAMPDLIISDYNLPMGLNGLEVIAKIQAQSPQPIPAIILTGDISGSSLSDIAKSGCVHLSKPVSVKELTLLAQRLLAEDLAAKPSQVAPQMIERQPRTKDNPPPTVFVVDDERAVREGLRDLLEEDGYLVEMFADGATFLEAYRPGRVDCLLVDSQMPGMSGIDVIARLQSSGHTLPAIVITGHGDVALAVQAMKAGAVEFIEKPIGSGVLLGLIATALDQPNNSLPRSAAQDMAAARLASLTARQREILELVLAGHPSKNIAVDIGISQRTVDNHRAAIMRKTGSKSLSALIRTALDAA